VHYIVILHFQNQGNEIDPMRLRCERVLRIVQIALLLVPYHGVAWRVHCT
jgi:hypothetical protein